MPPFAQDSLVLALKVLQLLSPGRTWTVGPPSCRRRMEVGCSRFARDGGGYG